MIIIVCCVIVCITTLTIVQMVFTHKEKIAKIQAKNNPITKLLGLNNEVKKED